MTSILIIFILMSMENLGKCMREALKCCFLGKVVVR